MAVVVYCVETFWRRGPTLERGQRSEHGSVAAATAEGERQARRRSGVLVYSVEGDPQSGIWQAPRVVARFGETPKLLRA